MIKIINHTIKTKAVYFRHCRRCGCDFEFNKEDIKDSFFDQRERCNVLYIPCPTCGDMTGVEDKPIRYE